MSSGGGFGLCRPMGLVAVGNLIFYRGGVSDIIRGVFRRLRGISLGVLGVISLLSSWVWISLGMWWSTRVASVVV